MDRDVRSDFRRETVTIKDITFNIGYFYCRSEGYYNSTGRACIICWDGLRRYVSIPARTKQFTVVFKRRSTGPDCFEIEPLDTATTVNRHARLLDHPKVVLVHSFGYKLREAHDAGYKYFQIEYED